MRIGPGMVRGLLRGTVVLFVLGGVGLPLAFGQQGNQATQPDLYDRQVAPQRIGRLPCAEIVEKVDRQRRRDPNHPVDVTSLSRRLHQSQLWVQQCMSVYGRHVEKPLALDAEEREEQMESWESRETNEIGHEETRDGRTTKQQVERHDRKKAPPTPRIFTGAVSSH